MPNINLLPEDVLPKEQTLGRVTTLRKIALIALVVFLITIAGVITLYLVNSYQLTNLNKNQEQLKASINDLESTEQRLVLVKDRLERIDQIQKTDKTKVAVVQMLEVTSNLPENVVVSNVKFSKSEIEVKYIAGSSTSMLGLFSKVISLSKNFTRIELFSLNYSDAIGYSVGLRYGV